MFEATGQPRRNVGGIEQNTIEQKEIFGKFKTSNTKRKVNRPQEHKPVYVGKPSSHLFVYQIRPQRDNDLLSQYNEHNSSQCDSVLQSTMTTGQQRTIKLIDLFVPQNAFEGAQSLTSKLA